MSQPPARQPDAFGKVRIDPNMTRCDSFRPYRTRGSGHEADAGLRCRMKHAMPRRRGSPHPTPHRWPVPHGRPHRGRSYWSLGASPQSAPSGRLGGGFPPRPASTSGVSQVGDMNRRGKLDAPARAGQPISSLDSDLLKTNPPCLLRIRFFLRLLADLTKTAPDRGAVFVSFSSQFFSPLARLRLSPAPSRAPPAATFFLRRCSCETPLW